LQNSVTLNVDFPDSGPIVRADTGQIQQVLTNLFTNAQESLHNNQGIIDLNIQTVSYEEIPVSNRFPLDWQPQDIPYACLEISDTGCGISKKDIVKLFDPFYTTKFTGRGMGLPVTMGNLKTHGGCIIVDSEAGRGSIFRAYLPVTTEINSVKHEKMATPKENVGNSGTVLLIEDEASVRYMVKAMLTRLGYAVIEAQDGVEALRLFQEHQNEIACVLSDLTMPRMNGWETLTELRRMGADVPVILASGYDKESVMTGDHPELPQAFLNKPYSMGALKDVLMEVIRFE
ncbi:MAG: response regulator, partial [Desulfobacteraceae bacterium]|nr:response regulator [Desulfobacteraceae bacterium]